MRELKGRSKAGLKFKESKIELTLNAGDICEGYIEVKTDNDTPMEGYVYSSSFRMRLGTDRISGSSISIPYEYDTAGMQQGDVQKGNFMFVTDLGEYMLPFVVTVNHRTLESSMGSIRNLFHFTNLAKSDWAEAVNLFYAPGFLDIMTGTDSKYRNLYLGLSAGGNRNHNLEEFLIGINKKKQIEYSVDNEDIRFAFTKAEPEHTVILRRNGWGYTLLAAKAEGDFIDIPDNRIDESCFENNVCNFVYGIREDKLHTGRNIGRITFKHLYGSISVEIVVTYGERSRNSGMVHRAKMARYSMVRYYLDYCSKATDKNKWIRLTEDIISHRANIDNDDMDNLLFQTYILILQERYNEAKWILDKKITDVIEEESNERYCFYLYLTALYSDDKYYWVEVKDRIKSIYSKNRDDWRIAWILLKIGRDASRDIGGMYDFALKQLARGSFSPVLYAEIISMLNESPSLLSDFSDEEVRVLWFATRNKMISPDLCGQIAYKVRELKHYNPKVIRILKGLYEQKQTDEILEAICVQFIRGSLVGEQYFKWYADGVDRGFNITRLYENYIMSIPDGQETDIPREVLMYFSYGKEPEYEQAAALYAYLIRHKDKLGDIYMAYGGLIERFISGQLKTGHISRDLAYLYENFIRSGMATEEDAKNLSKLLLTHMIQVDDPIIASVIVRDERLTDELTYPVNDKKALVILPSSEYTILLEDTLGNRYYSTKEYNTERFFLPRKLMALLEPYTDDSVLFDLYVCEGNRDYIVVGERNVGRYRYLEQCDEVASDFRAAIKFPLVRYYQDNDETALLDDLLDRTDITDVPYKDREELIRLFIARGQIDRAYDTILYYGPESMDGQILVRIATLRIDRDGYIEDPAMSAMIMSAFERGRYNDTVLLYLSKFYKGPSKYLRDIWKAASGFYVDTYSICETMIVQTLQTGAYIGEEAAVLKEYVTGGGRTELTLKYITYFARAYLLYDHVVDGYFFTEMARIYENEGDLPVVCMLAFLKYFAYNVKPRDITEDMAAHIRRYMQILYVEKGITMSFMQAFPDISDESRALSKHTIIEYKGLPNSKVTINYLVFGENTEYYGYTRDEMREAFEGLYVRDFLLFFGDTLQYYIAEKNDDFEELSQSGSVTRNDADTSDYADAFNIINDIALATTLRDYDTAFCLLDEYKYKEYMTGQMFVPQ